MMAMFSFELLALFWNTGSLRIKMENLRVGVRRGDGMRGDGAVKGNENW